MKVSQLIENDEWSNSEIDPKTYFNSLVKKRESLTHERQIVLMKMQKQFDLTDEPGWFRRLESWNLRHQRVEDFPEHLQPFIKELQRIDIQSELLQKQEVAAKVNQKYSRHNADLALRHALACRVGIGYPEGEDAIASNPQIALRYAKEVISKRFPKGEAAIRSDNTIKQEYQSFLRNHRPHEEYKAYITDHRKNPEDFKK